MHYGTASRTLYDGTTEYVRVTLTADAVIGDQPVYFSLDRVDWVAAEWEGAPDTTRTARLLYGVGAEPHPERGHSAPFFVRLTDDPEAPVIYAGLLRVL